jgi:hypothetical protein
MTRKEMMDKMIKERGFEDELTIWFCKLAESEVSNTTVELAYAVVIK